MTLMKQKFAGLIFFSLLLGACGPSDGEKAQQLVDDAYILVHDGQWRQARFLLDSVHNCYPGEVTQRRLAKALEDSVVYLEAQKSLLYVDSILPPLEQRADVLLKQFRYEKDERYEDHGRYVHRLLATASNTSRNFLQAYVRDDRKTILKSYYFGPSAVHQQTLTLSAAGEEVHFTGTNHSFEAEGWHEIMTLEDDPALRLLNFISAHIKDRLRVKGEGDKPTRTWVYYLNDQEKTALSQTYELGWLMKDILQAEDIRNKSQRQIERYEQKYK